MATKIRPINLHTTVDTHIQGLIDSSFVQARQTAGTDSAMSFHSISVMFLTNKIATYNNAAPSISFGRLVARGEKNKQAKNRTPITKEVIPVLPPAFTPAPDST